MTRRDEDLMSDVQAGRFESFDELVSRYRAPLWRLAHSKLAEPQFAEDVVQEAFLAVFAARHTYRTGAPFRTWLWTIALNLCKRHARRNARRPMSNADDELTSGPASRLFTAGTLHQVLMTERLEQLRQALEELPEAEADAVRLRFFGGLKFEEIAGAMECSVSGAKVRVKRGLMKLGQRLALSEEPEP